MAEDDDIPPLEDIPISSTSTSVVSTPQVKYVQPAPVNEPPKSFAGMKKGFLTSTKKSDELIEIKRSTKDFRVLDEVQQAIKDEQRSTNNWLTDDLLKQIEEDQSLSRYFSNPYFMEAITLFQHKPQEALAKYGHNAEVMQFFGRMGKLLGKHLTAMNEKDEKQKMPHVDPEVNKLLQDESTRQLLMDPAVVQLMKMLREQPDRAQWIMRTADASMRAKIQRLIELRLLSIV